MPAESLRQMTIQSFVNFIKEEISMENAGTLREKVDAFTGEFAKEHKIDPFIRDIRRSVPHQYGNLTKGAFSFVNDTKSRKRIRVTREAHSPSCFSSRDERRYADPTNLHHCDFDMLPNDELFFEKDRCECQNYSIREISKKGNTKSNPTQTNLVSGLDYNFDVSILKHDFCIKDNIPPIPDNSLDLFVSLSIARKPYDSKTGLSYGQYLALKDFIDDEDSECDQ